MLAAATAVFVYYTVWTLFMVSNFSATTSPQMYSSSPWPYN